MQGELSGEMITARQGRTGVYFTASVVEEMMSVNRQNVEMGTHQERGSLGLSKTPMNHCSVVTCRLGAFCKLPSCSEGARVL